MEIILYVVNKILGNPIVSGALGVSAIALGVWAGAEHFDIQYKNSEIATLNNTIEADKIALTNWQNRFAQLQSVTDDQNKQIEAFQAKDKDLEAKITASNTEIDNFEKQLQADAKEIAKQVIPNDCPAALDVLVNNTKKNVGRLKIERTDR